MRDLDSRSVFQRFFIAAHTGYDQRRVCIRSDQNNQEGQPVSEHVYKLIELTGTSPQGIEAAIENALARAAKTMRNLRWFEVLDTRGHIEDGKVAHYQVTVKVGFTLED